MPSQSRSGLPRSDHSDAARRYSVSLLQAAAALYGADVARTLSGQRPTSQTPQTKKKFRE
jgi:hypothetical protein